ncbi:MAG: hypothetical protein AB1485_00070 [Candidatus Thermoplasmatota archaeon]
MGVEKDMGEAEEEIVATLRAIAGNPEAEVLEKRYNIWKERVNRLGNSLKEVIAKFLPENGQAQLEVAETAEEFAEIERKYTPYIRKIAAEQPEDVWEEASKRIDVLLNDAIRLREILNKERKEILKECRKLAKKRFWRIREK